MSKSELEEDETSSQWQEVVTSSFDVKIMQAYFV